MLFYNQLVYLSIDDLFCQQYQKLIQYQLFNFEIVDYK